MLHSATRDNMKEKSMYDLGNVTAEVTSVASQTSSHWELNNTAKEETKQALHSGLNRDGPAPSVSTQTAKALCRTGQDHFETPVPL